MIHFRDLQDFLYQGQHLPMRPHYRDLVILYRQRIKVLNRLRSQNFDLYCKTMELLNLEHHQEPILKDRFQIDWQNRLNLTQLLTCRDLCLTSKRINGTGLLRTSTSSPSRSLTSSPSKAFVVGVQASGIYSYNLYIQHRSLRMETRNLKIPDGEGVTDLQRPVKDFVTRL